METIDLEVSVRDGRGKSAARASRRRGQLPGVLYGGQRAAAAIMLDAREFEKKVAALQGSHLIRLQSTVPDIAGKLALVKEMQRDPITRAVLHADLYEVDVARKLHLRVPLRFVGKAAGVERGGILQPIHRDIEVHCLPTEIPEFIEVDVSALDIHDAIHVSQLSTASGVEIVFDTDDTLVTVLPPTVEEVKVAAPEVIEGAPAEEAAPAEAAKTESGKGAA